jgi:hypothetical protein
MPEGRIPFKDAADLAVLDTSATEPNYNPIMRERLKDPASDDDGREETVYTDVRCGLEHDRSELQRMSRSSNIPDGALGLFVHMRDMRRGDGTTSYVRADGSLIFLNARLIRTVARGGNVVETFDGNPKPQMYCIEIRPLQSSLGRGGPNLQLMLFADRPKGRA